MDARGVSKLYMARPTGRYVALLALAAAVVLFAVIALSPSIQDQIRSAIDSFWWQAYTKLRLWEWRR